MTHGGTPSVAWMSGGVARRWLEIFPAFDVGYRREKNYCILKTSCNSTGLGVGGVKTFYIHFNNISLKIRIYYLNI